MVGPIAAAVVVAFVAGGGIAWSVQAKRVTAIEDARVHQVKAIISNHDKYRAEVLAASERLRAAELIRSMQVENDLQETINDLRNEIDTRPPRIIRVRVCDPKTVYAGRDADSGAAPAFGDGASPYSRGVGRDAGEGSETIELDLSGLDNLVDQAKLVSERLRACQRRLVEMSPK
jgi:hypothetical protein